MHLVSTSENKETEKRVALTPEIAKKYIDLGFKLSLPNNYGSHLGFDDEQYKTFGVSFLGDEREIINNANIIIQLGLPKDDILSEKSIQNPGYADAIGCSIFDYQEFSDEIIKKQGKKQKKQGFKGFFSWLDQYI